MDEIDVEELLQTEVAGLPQGFRLPERYRPQKSLGHGGMGVVFRAWDSTLERLVAIKIIRPDKLSNRRIRKRFEREVSCLAGINHPNVIRVFDYDRAGEVDYYVMEYIEGLTFGALLRRDEVDIKRAVSVSCQVTDGLCAVHETGLIHRDIKPENILLAKDGSAKLMDFGLVGAIDLENMTRVTQTGHAVGTSGYMPPEMFLKGKADMRSDVFQIGVCLYEGLTKELPLTPKMLGALIAGGGSPSPTPPSHYTRLPDERLDSICLKAVAFRPADRYQQACQLRDELRQWLLEWDRTRPRPLPKKGQQRQADRLSEEKGERINDTNEAKGNDGEVAEATIAMEQDSLNVMESSGEVTLSTKTRPSSFMFLLLFVLTFAYVLYSISPPSGGRIHEVIGLSVAGRGVNSALVTWTANWKEVRPSLFMEKIEGTFPVNVKTVTISEEKASEGHDKPCYTHRAIITGLQAGTDYKIRFKKPDGTFTLGRRFKTLKEVRFQPETKVELTKDGSLRICFEGAIPFSIRLTHTPLRYEPAPCLKETDGRKTTSVIYDLTSLSNVVNIGATLTSIDQTIVTTSIFPRRALQKSFRNIYKEFSKEHSSGAFLRQFQGGTRRRNEFFYSTARLINNLKLNDKSQRKKLVEEFWQSVDKKLRANSLWYPQLTDMLSGLPHLLSSGLCNDDIRQSVELALLPLELVNGAAIWYRIPANEKWAPLLTGPLRPNPSLSGQSSFNSITSKIDCTVSLLPELPVRILLDKYDSEATKLVEKEMIEYLGKHEFSFDIQDVPTGKVELELRVRSANMGSALLADINDGAAYLTFPMKEDDFREYDKNMEESRSYTKIGGMAIMGTFGSINHYQSSIADMDLAFPKKVYSYFHRLPAKALHKGKNRVVLTVLTGPVDIPRPTLLVGLAFLTGQ